MKQAASPGALAPGWSLGCAGAETFSKIGRPGWWIWLVDLAGIESFPAQSARLLPGFNRKFHPHCVRNRNQRGQARIAVG